MGATWRTAVLAVLTILCLVPSAVLAQAIDFDELVRRAQAEGEVTLYTSSSRESAEALLKAFEERYGIQTRIYRAGTTEVAQRVYEEAMSGNVSADVFLTGAPLISDLADMGLPLARLDFSRELANYPDYTYTDNWAYVTAIGVFIMYNTELVPPELVPQDWDDLLNPRWKGQMALPDPAGSSTPQVWMYMMMDIRSQDWLRQLGEQDLTIYPVHGSAAEAVERGEVAISVEMLSDRIAASQLSGAPVAYSVPSPTFLLPRQIAIPQGAPHPNAARLLFEFMMSEEGQRLFNVDWGQYSYRIGIEHPGLYPLDQIDQYFPDWADVSANRSEILMMADEYFR